jgi:hypothetical protein
MTDADRDMLLSIYWSVTLFKAVLGFYLGYHFAEWVKRVLGE